MGFFHKTLKDAKKLFNIDRQRAIKILREHEADTRKLRSAIDIGLLDYYDGLGGVCEALEKNDIEQANMWIEGQRKSLRNLKRQLEKLKRAIE
ncbi:MAG: hypothetical protein C4541_04920 [Candidatus Auribacter fodinae]|jgi:hypothetical protein|uniref:Uncharacterized protein n=1 Tax=Candidatus Auribacter fodinae TaxID=2093366 RepID=A0A3A4R575_9BACT|nr:MAG: hypothetical protein C4541_04920 [Candidatus Auribacter fodinae]